MTPGYGTVVTRIAPRLSGLRTATWRIIDYGFFRWTMDRDGSSPEASVFRYDQASTTVVLYWAVFLSALLEIPILHLIIGRWSHPMAWVASGIGVIAVIYIIALIKGIYFRPVVLTDSHLLIRFGIRNEIAIPRKDIVSIEAAEAIRPDAIRMYKADPPNIRVISNQAGNTSVIDFFLTEPNRLLNVYAKHDGRLNFSPNSRP